jgi:hypothetical protein
LKIPKGQLETVYQPGADNTMARRKITNNDLKINTRPKSRD